MLKSSKETKGVSQMPKSNGLRKKRYLKCHVGRKLQQMVLVHLPDLLDALSLWRFVPGQLERTYLQVSPISCRGEVQTLQPFSLQWNCEGRKQISQDGVFRLSHPSFVTNHYAAAEIIQIIQNTAHVQLGHRLHRAGCIYELHLKWCHYCCVMLVSTGSAMRGKNKHVCSSHSSLHLLPTSQFVPCLPWVQPTVGTLRNSETTGIRNRISETTGIVNRMKSNTAT